MERKISAMSVIEVKNDKTKCDALLSENADPFRMCEIYAESLPFPVVVLDENNVIVYKNSNMSCIDCKWRRGSSIKRYVTLEAFWALNTLKVGEYTVIYTLNVGAAAVKVGDYKFIVFMPLFEINSELVEELYNCMGNIPEEDFFEKRKIELSDKASEESKRCWNKFKNNFSKFYRNRCIYGSKISNALLGEVSRKEHDLINTLKMITNAVNSSADVGFKIKTDGKLNLKQHYVNCSSTDLGAVLSMAVYLCVQCASSANPTVKLDISQNTLNSMLEVCISVKSDYVLSDKKVTGFIDEKHLYFQTIRHLASKYFWGFKTLNYNSMLHFVLLFPECPVSSSYLYDRVMLSDIEAKDFFVQFFNTFCEDQ